MIIWTGEWRPIDKAHRLELAMAPKHSKPSPDVEEPTTRRISSSAVQAVSPAPKLPVKVIVADDSYVIREFITDTLGADQDVELMAVCTNGTELVAAITRWKPDVIVTDIRMPPSGDAEGIRVAEELHESHPDIGVVVVSQYADPAYALALFRHGTRGRAYLLKERVGDRRELVEAIFAVARHDSVVDPMIVDVLLQARLQASASRLSELTARELELLAEIATGKSNGAIARSLFLSKRAVEKHINSIFFKLDLPESDDVSRRVKATLFYLAEHPEEIEP